MTAEPVGTYRVSAFNKARIQQGLAPLPMQQCCVCGAELKYSWRKINPRRCYKCVKKKEKP